MNLLRIFGPTGGGKTTDLPNLPTKDIAYTIAQLYILRGDQIGGEKA